MLRPLNEIRALKDPIKQNQVEFTICNFPGYALAVGTQKLAGFLSGNRDTATIKELTLRATSFSYPGAKIKQSEIILGGLRRKIGTIQDKSGIFTCTVTEDNGGSVLNIISAWCDLIHSTMLGTRLPNALYNTFCQLKLGGHCGPEHERTIYLKNFYPIEYKVNEIDASSSAPINITISFNYDYFTDNSYSLYALTL